MTLYIWILSITIKNTPLSTMTLTITAHDTVMLSVFAKSATNKPITPIVILPGVITLSVVAPIKLKINCQIYVAGSVKFFTVVIYTIS
jgi:hypothetical protein